MFLLIWGSENGQKEIGSGPFYCPSCRRHTTYSHVRVSRYFTFFYITICPLYTLGDAIFCQACAAEFTPEVLSLTVDQIDRAAQNWHCAHCRNCNSPAEGRCLACGQPRTASPPPLPLPQNGRRTQLTLPARADVNPSCPHCGMSKYHAIGCPERKKSA